MYPHGTLFMPFLEAMKANAINKSARTKAQLETERQRQRIADDSVFGIWTDTQKTVRVRISPVGNVIRVRIVDILNPSVIDAIFFLCGITTPVRRSKWTHFDLVTNLVKRSYLNEYVFGEVHLPRAQRSAGASLVVQEKSRIQLNFFDHPDDAANTCTGSIVFCKDPSWHNRKKKAA